MSAAGAYRRIARRYFRAALLYLSLGTVLGALMLWFGNDNMQFLHGHMLLIGAALFAAYGAGYSWIAGRAEASPPPGTAAASSASLATAQFWLANIGLPGMLAGSVLPVGLGLDRIGVLFGFMEAAAAVMFAVVIRRTGTFMSSPAK